MMNPAEFANIAASEREFWWYRGMRDILYSVLDPIALEHSFERVLETGCGTGYLSKVLAERYGWPMIPLDLGYEGLEYARDMGLRRLVQADIAALPFASGSIDMLLSMDVVVHFPLGQEHQPVAEFFRVLKPGGFLALRVSALDILRSRHSMFAHERQRFTRDRLLNLIRTAGFDVRSCTFCNSLLLPVALAKFRIWEPLTNAKPASGVSPVAPWLDRILAQPLKWEARWIARGGRFPIGQSLLLVASKPAKP
ncbi:MAG: class I SAM-dependent methyltransferase [Bryobacteraceae bacterium]|nr:class I SAM-dependent methyltransferase [Bryobacteraceae bacterium]